MAAIVAGDVSLVVWDKEFILKAGQDKRNIRIHGRLQIDPGTTDTYVTGGIPLTNLFTTGNGSYTGIDPAKPIMGVCGPARISDAVAPACAALYYDGGATAASQTLVLLIPPADDGTKNDTLVQYPAEDITTNTTVTTPLANGDKDIYVDIIIWGTEA